MPTPDRLSAALADRYRVERELGQGGMATVYLAEDLKHKRKVALKVLKPELAAVLGAERFVQEITTTASLQHPHILPLFDSGSADGFLFYVMPFIDGETLRKKLDRESQLGIDEAVRITTNVADALDYAHRRGVIHRDIKPENILLHDGRPMVADFGIALALSAAAGGRMTETGLSLGTPHYMSPEQATAEKEITARADVYSLGSVLYEMLTGNPPHVGATAQQIIMRIIADTPRPVTEVRKSVPANVAAAVSKSIEKLPADRFETAAAFADALKNPAFTLTSLSGDAHASATARRSRYVIPLAAAALLFLAAAVWGWMRPTPELPLTRLDLSLEGLVPRLNGDVVISPDGSMLAVAAGEGEGAVYIRQLGGDPHFRKLAGTEGAQNTPSFSPDSKWIVFRRLPDGALVKASVAGGGTSIVVRGDFGLVTYPHWGTQETIVFSGGQPAFGRVGASGEAAMLFPKSRNAARHNFLLPDGSGALITVSSAVFFYDFARDSAIRLIENASHASYVETGHVIYVAEGGLFAVPFDLGSHRVAGTPVRVLDRVGAAVLRRGYSVSKHGTLVFVDGESSVGSGGAATRLLMIDLTASKVDTLKLPVGRRLDPRISPDGRTIAYEFTVAARNNATDLYTFDLVTGTNTQLTFDGDNDDPRWSPDGKRIAFTKSGSATEEDIYVKPADNSQAEQLLLAQQRIQNPSAWIDSQTIAMTSNAAGNIDLFTLTAKAGEKPKPYLQAPWDELDLMVDRDRKLAAFTSREGGTLDVWVRDFPVAQGKWRVSTGGGQGPRWSPDGHYVYYWRAGPVDTLYRARVDRTPAVVVRPPERVLTIDVTQLSGWDIHPDGKRVLVVVDEAAPRAIGPGGVLVPDRYVVVQNWFTELKARVNEARR